MVKVSFFIAAFAMLFSANGVALDGGAQASMSVASTAKMRRASVPTSAAKSDKTDVVQQKLEEVEALQDQQASLAKQQQAAADQAKAEDMKIFKVADQDGNGFLSGDEITNLMTHVGLPPNLLSWTEFDHDKDNQLSPAEFLEAGPAVSAAFQHLKAAHSFRISQDRNIFHSFDKDHSGFLDATEMANVERAVGLEFGKLNWHLFDQDKDGGLSETEFIAAGPTVAAAIKEHVRNGGTILAAENTDQDQAKPKLYAGDDTGKPPKDSEKPPPNGDKPESHGHPGEEKDGSKAGSSKQSDGSSKAGSGPSPSKSPGPSPSPDSPSAGAGKAPAPDQPSAGAGKAPAQAGAAQDPGDGGGRDDGENGDGGAGGSL